MPIIGRRTQTPFRSLIAKAARFPREGLKATLVLVAFILPLAVLAPQSYAQSSRGQATAPALEAYAALPAISSVRVSDDGRELAYLRRQGDTTEAIVQSRSGDVLVSVNLGDRRATGIGWVSPNHVAITSLVMNAEFLGGRDYLPQMDLVNVRTRNVARVLRSADRGVINAVFDSWRGEAGGEPALFVQAVTTENNAYTRDVYRIDLDSGRGRRVETGLEDTRSYLLRSDGSVAARIATNPDNGRFRLTVPSGGGYRTIFEQVAPLDGPGIWGFAQDPDKVIVSTLENGEPRLSALSLSTGAITEIEDLDAEASGPLYDRFQRLVGIGTLAEDMQYVFFEPRLEAAWQVMRRGLPNNRLAPVSYSADYQVMVVHSESGNDAGTYYLYDAAARSLNVVGREYPLVDPANIGPMSIVEYRAADGMEQVGYLTLPRNRQARNLPLILFPHGGPAARDHLGFDWWAQAMASRGYAVFQPQFRGSAGFTQAYMEAGYGEWGRKMQTDLNDAVSHLAQQGVIDPGRVCIVGASYGGYAALAGVAMYPDVYRCAVSVAGVSDLRAMLDSEARSAGYGSQSRNPVIRYWNRFMGGAGLRDRSLDERSPAYLVANINDPVLLIHGRNDTIVPYNQSEIMRNAMRAANKPVELIELPGEDHGLSFAPTRRQMLNATIAFLERHNPPN
jgi:Dipeptidyl aminopeptidases/acylaminoacyl-peptidases